MLTGRKSLIRTIGKRRHFLPNRRSILSSPSSSRSLISVCKSDEIEKKYSIEEKSAAAAESVNCPVCGLQFPSEDNNVINSHIDECLARGNKRKLSQRTLLELNFSRSKIKVHSIPPDDRENQVLPTSDGIDKLKELDSSEESDDDQRKSNFSSAALTIKSEENCINNLFCDGIINDKLASPPLFSDSSKHVMENGMDDLDISKVFLPTFIVGRKYGKREELNPESRICLSREPENLKDSNAIKVIYADCEYDNLLGYLPRELAQYLSPLIDIFNLNFEGRITSVPKDSRAAIPLDIVCKNDLLCDEKYCDDIQHFKTLWRQALRAVELAKTNPSGATRYQHNMALLILEVIKGNQHLFTTSEKSFLEAFNSLPDDSQRLFARLYTRKGPWFRMSNISYPEIDDLNQAVKGLSESGYICSFPWKNGVEDNDLEEVLNVLNIDELKEALRMLNKKTNHFTRKQDIINCLLSSCKHELCSELQIFVLSKTGACVRISPLAEALMWRAERLFFLNGEQDLSSFLLVDLGIVKYPAYNCIISEPNFSNRSDLLSYEEAIEISQIMDESLDETNSELVLRCIEISVSRMPFSLEEHKSSSGGPKAASVSHISASWVYSKVVLLGVSFYEREKRYNDAINLLRQLLSTFICDGRRGYWTLRLSVDLEHVKCLEDSLRVAEDGLLDSWVRAGSRVALQRRVLRLGKPPRRWKIPSYSTSVKRKIAEVYVQGRPLNCKTGMKSVFYDEDGEQCGVEELALQYYAGEGGGWQGVHTESGIWLTIFGILMWDVIFADVPNVFRNKFQTAPLDFATDHFYESRKPLIESLLSQIQSGMGEEILITNYDSHFGTSCRGVNWEKHPLTELRAAVKCIGSTSLASICRHLAQDYRSWSSGMPDLLLWRIHDCYRGEAKLVEVKGPKDRLSEQQRAWLLLLMDCGFDVEVCKVTPAMVTHD